MKYLVCISILSLALVSCISSHQNHSSNSNESGHIGSGTLDNGKKVQIVAGDTNNEQVWIDYIKAHNERDLAIYKIAIKKWLKNEERLKYPDLPEILKTHKNQKSFLDRYKVVDPNGYSHTMVAHISKDGHHYIYPDTKQVRSLSVREAARIQSFSDDFFFEGGRSAAFRQIGNAVP